MMDGDTDDSEPKEPHGKYEGLDNKELQLKICDINNNADCDKCPISSHNNGRGVWDNEFIRRYPDEARKLMLDYLNGLEGKE